MTLGKRNSHLEIWHMLVCEHIPSMPKGSAYQYASTHILTTSDLEPAEWFAVMAAFSMLLTDDMEGNGARVQYLHWQINKPLNQSELIARKLSGGLS